MKGFTHGSEKEKDEARKLYLSGLSADEVGRRLNRNSTTIGTWCKDILIKYSQKGKHHKSPPPFTKEHRERIAKSKRGEKNINWKGKNAGITAIHHWVGRRKPKVELCVRCKQRKAIDLANISQKYKRDVNDFEWLCRSCHMTEDGRMNKLVHVKKGIGGSKVNEKIVIEIRKKYKKYNSQENLKIFQNNLAKEYGLSIDGIRHIIYRSTCKNVI